MHTIIRHTLTDSGFAIVVTGRAADPVGARLQEYDTSKTVGNNYTTLLTDYPYTDERDAIKQFNWVYFSNKTIDHEG